MSTAQFAGIQVFRFLAAILVVVMNTSEAISLRSRDAGSGHFWSGGSAGVDIFFVIRGFVMAMSTSGLPASGAVRLSAAGTFMKRRLMRIATLDWPYVLLKAAMVLALPGLALRSSVDPVKHLGIHDARVINPAAGLIVIVSGCLSYGWRERPMTRFLKRTLFSLPKLSFAQS